MTGEEWLAMGIERGWIDDPVCWTHNMPELSDEEDELIELGDVDSLCILITRVRVGG